MEIDELCHPTACLSDGCLTKGCLQAGDAGLTGCICSIGHMVCNGDCSKLPPEELENL